MTRCCFLRQRVVLIALCSRFVSCGLCRVMAGGFAVPNASCGVLVVDVLASRGAFQLGGSGVVEFGVGCVRALHP